MSLERTDERKRKVILSYMELVDTLQIISTIQCSATEDVDEHEHMTDVLQKFISSITADDGEGVGCIVELNEYYRFNIWLALDQYKSFLKAENHADGVLQYEITMAKFGGKSW
jgi:IS30 family transposase